MSLENRKENIGQTLNSEQLQPTILPNAKKHLEKQILAKETGEQKAPSDPKVYFPPAVKPREEEAVGFIPNAGKFFSDLYGGFKKAVGYIPNIPESAVYVVLLNIPSFARAIVSPVMIAAKSISSSLSSSEFDFGKILREEQDAILMVEPKSRWINAVREFCNTYIPGGSLLGKDEVFARTSDEKLKEILNPLSNISKAIVEPLTTPLHDVAQGLTDRVTYSVYIHFSKEKCLGYPEFLKEVEDEKNWQLRMGRAALYTAETLVIAYCCGAAGAKTKKEGILKMGQFLKMPIIMSGFQAIATVLKREDFHKLTTAEVAAVIFTEIPKGMFDSAAFMLPISKLSQWNINRGINKLNKQMLASSSSSAKLPTPSISQYQADVNKLMLRTQGWGEMYDFAEGMPDAQTKGIELKDRIIELTLNPFSISKDNWKLARLTGSAALEFASSALDLVDGKKGHKKSLHAVSENAQSEVDKTLKGNTYELEGGVEEVQQYFCDYHYRKLAIEGVESVLTYFGITTFSSNDQLRKEIENRSKNVYAFYDGERDVIFVPKITESVSREEELLHQSFVEHEKFHRRVALHPGGIEAVIREQPYLVAVINERILPTHNQYFNSNKNLRDLSPKLLEEYAAVATQLLTIEDNNIFNFFDFSSLLINSAVTAGTIDFIDGIMLATKSKVVKEPKPKITLLDLPSRLSRLEIVNAGINSDLLKSLTPELIKLSGDGIARIKIGFSLAVKDQTKAVGAYLEPLPGTNLYVLNSISGDLSDIQNTPISSISLIHCIDAPSSNRVVLQPIYERGNQPFEVLSQLQGEMVKIEFKRDKERYSQEVIGRIVKVNEDGSVKLAWAKPKGANTSITFNFVDGNFAGSANAVENIEWTLQGDIEIVKITRAGDRRFDWDYFPSAITTDVTSEKQLEEIDLTLKEFVLDEVERNLLIKAILNEVDINKITDLLDRIKTELEIAKNDFSINIFIRKFVYERISRQAKKIQEAFPPGAKIEAEVEYLVPITKGYNQVEYQTKKEKIRGTFIGVDQGGRLMSPLVLIKDEKGKLYAYRFNEIKSMKAINEGNVERNTLLYVLENGVIYDSEGE